MPKNFTVKTIVTINAPASRVWEALTTPEIVKQFLFGTEVISDWKKGSSITYKGILHEKSYEDKGTILNVVPEKLFEYTIWSSMAGTLDIPENYKKITYELTPENGGTKLIITQSNNPTDGEKRHADWSWDLITKNLKKLLEK